MAARVWASAPEVIGLGTPYADLDDQGDQQMVVRRVRHGGIIIVVVIVQ